MSRILILDGSIDPEMYRPADQWKALAGEAEAVSVHLPSGERVPPLAQYTHLIVTGSEGSIVEHQTWSGHLPVLAVEDCDPHLQALPAGGDRQLPAPPSRVPVACDGSPEERALVEALGLEPVDGRYWRVYFAWIWLGVFDVHTRKMLRRPQARRTAAWLGSSMEDRPSATLQDDPPSR